MIKIKSFEEAGLKPEILKAIQEIGYEVPSEIQSEVLPFLWQNEQDLIALAQTGTGKTAAFGLPIINSIDPSNKNTQALILSPTRELALQISQDLEGYTKYMPEIRVEAVYGGASIENQIKAIKKGAQIIVGTPGRTLDLLKRKVLKINNIKTVVFDEADEMLSMGFQDDLDAILDYTGPDKQTLFFSATMPQEAVKLTKKYMRNPHTIQVGTRNMASSNVTHQYCLVHEKDRYKALKRLLDVNPGVYGIIFCRTRKETQEISDKLMKDSYQIDALHGDMTQSQRDWVMRRFKDGHLKVLCATDVAARGLDVNDLNLVINYKLPDDPEVYVHRSGRTGRAGKTGVSISLINYKEKSRLKQIERLAKKEFEQVPIPQVEDICKNQLIYWAQNVAETNIERPEVKQYASEIYQQLNHFTKEELIQKFVAVEFRQLLSYYKDATDLNLNAGKSDRSEDREDRKSKKGKRRNDYARLFIQVGKLDKLKSRDIIMMLNDSFPKEKIDIGAIDIMRSFTFFEVPKSDSNRVVKKLQNSTIKGKKTGIQFANDRKK